MLLATAGVLAGAYQSEIPIPTDYIHKYTWDNISGTSLIDEGSDPVNGTINSGVTTGIKGRGGNAGYFDASDNANVTVTGHDWWTNGFSFHAYVFYDGSGSNSIFTAGESLGSASGRDFDIYVTSGNDFGIGVVASNGSSYVLTLYAPSGTSVPVGEWFVLTVKWDGTTDAGGVVVKINNQVQAVDAASSDQMTGTPAATKTPRIGGYIAGGAYEWDGFQRYHLIYDYETTDAQDTAIYNEFVAAKTSVISGIPVPADDNVIYEVDTSTAASWTGSGLTSDGSSLTLASTGSQNEVTLDIDGPSFGDFIFYATISGENSAGSSATIQLGQQGNGTITVTLGYNWETSSNEVNRVSAFAGSGIAGPIVDFSASSVQIAVQYDSRLGVGNFFVKESGVWEFYGSASMSAPYRDKLSIYTGGSDNNDITVDEWFIAYPNYMVIGDSIAAGHNLFDPDPSYYAGDDDYTSTWMYYADLGDGLRNNIIVNYGEGGEDSSEIEDRVVDALVKTQARTVFLHCSTNDLGAGFSDAQRLANIQGSVDKLKQFSDTQVVLLNSVYAASFSYYPDWWSGFSGDVSSVSSAVDIMGGSGILDGTYMDPAYVQGDGVHPNPTGFGLIGNYIESQE